MLTVIPVLRGATRGTFVETKKILAGTVIGAALASTAKLDQRRFALGQAGATHFINSHGKSPEARLRTLDALTAIVAR